MLPYLEETELYKQYRFTEPWNGPNNRQLGSSCHEIYRERSSAISNDTRFVAVTGPGTVWDASGDTRKLRTRSGKAPIMLVEMAHSGIHWMEPRDLTLADLDRGVNSGDPRGIHGIHPDFALAARSDGEVIQLPTGMDVEELKEMFLVVPSDEK